MHPWIWIGCDTCNFSRLAPLSFLPRTRMWSKVHNSLPVRRECLVLQFLSHRFLVTMSPHWCVMLIGNCKLLPWLHKHSILQGSNTDHRIPHRFNAPIDQTRIINLLLSSRIIILEDMIFMRWFWVFLLNHSNIMTQYDLPSHIYALISRIQINIASYV